MQRRCVLCLDIGTSSIKAGLICEQGELEWFFHHPLLKQEQDLYNWNPVQWIEGCIQVSKACMAALQPDQELSGIVLSGNGPTIVPMDTGDTPAAPALLWLDRRNQAIPGSPSFYLPKVAWFASHHPVESSRTAYFLSCPEYVGHWLSGVRHTVLVNDAYMPFFWDKAQLSSYGFDAKLFPSYVPIGHTIGKVRKAAADQSTLPEGLPVLSGGSDFLMSLLGTATIKPGRICDRAGSSEGINFCSASPLVSPRLRTLPHILPEYSNVAAILSSTGRMFEWFRGISGQRKVPYAEMLRSIASLPILGDYPFFIPNHLDPGNWEFSQGLFLKLEARHEAVHLGRAVVESIGFAVYEGISNLEAAGCEVSEIRLCGGQAKNERWNQMKANITGKTLLVPKLADAELLGNAVCAFKALGSFSNITEAAEQLVGFKQRIEPDPKVHEQWMQRYQAYRDIQKNIKSKGLF